MNASVQGAFHKQGGQENQDAVRQRMPSRGDELLLLAVADGHGSTRSFRSERGAALAAECALSELRHFLRRLGPFTPLSRIRNQARTRWPAAMIEAWRSTVRADLLLHPFSSVDFAAFPEPPPAVSPGRELPVSAYLAYGATLLAVAITPRFILYSQLGDGDILAVNSSGDVYRPMPRRHEFMANQTISLCSYRAADEFQIRVDSLRGPDPALVMLSTDGYANCFGNDEAFFKVGVDFLSYLRREGTAFVSEKLEDWLRQSSHDGSGDDITVGLAARENAVRPSKVEPTPFS